MHKLMNKKSCWGCGHDYLSAGYKSEDLAPVDLYGVDEWICPDCYDEIPEDAMEVAR